jgi:hypothetical protein
MLNSRRSVLRRLPLCCRLAAVTRPKRRRRTLEKQSAAMSENPTAKPDVRTAAAGKPIKALSGIPADPSRQRSLAEEDPRQDPLRRQVGPGRRQSRAGRASSRRTPSRCRHRGRPVPRHSDDHHSTATASIRAFGRENATSIRREPIRELRSFIPSIARDGSRSCVSRRESYPRPILKLPATPQPESITGHPTSGT